MTQEKLKSKAVSRANNFRYDAEVDSARPTDYARSGYDRGHMVPAEDQRWSAQAMADSFLMSNMAPQKPCSNRGLWKKLEGQVRDWAEKYNELFVVTGPITSETDDAIPNTKIRIPKRFFKVVLEKKNGTKAIGFIIPNNCTKGDLKQFSVPVREIETAAHLDFFPSLPDEIESKVEANLDYESW